MGQEIQWQRRKQRKKERQKERKKERKRGPTYGNNISYPIGLIQVEHEARWMDPRLLDAVSHPSITSQEISAFTSRRAASEGLRDSSSFLFLSLFFSFLFSLASLWLFPLFFSHKHRQRERHRETQTHTHTPTGYVAVCVCVCMWALMWRFKCRGLSGSQQQVISH